jgi:hypothetical protein
VICPYTQIHEKTERALQAFAPNVERILTSYCSPQIDCGMSSCLWKERPIAHCHHERCNRAYCDLVTRWWGEGETFLLIEHDIEIHEGVVEAAERCSETWCVWPYRASGFSTQPDAYLKGALGCTKFSAALMEQESDLLLVAGAKAEGLAAGDWRRLDVSILPTLRQRGYEAHLHETVLQHHNYPNEGCSCGDPLC